MKLKIIDQILKITFLFALVIFVVLWNNGHFFFGLAVFFGAIWGCVNLLLIKHLLQIFLLPSAKKGWKNHFLLGVKFPLLYFIGYILLSFEDFSAYALMSGFSLLLAVTVAIGVLSSLTKIARPTEKPLADNRHGK